MSLKVEYQNNHKIYNVSGYDSGSLPDWLVSQHRRQLKKDPEFSGRIDLIQGLEFPEASYRIKFTADGRYIVSTGTYKPQIRVFDCDELHMKFERHTNEENVQFVPLESDWTKLVLLQNNRHLEFHTQGGIHYSMRIPKFGRDIKYDDISCDLFIVGSGREVYTLNLEQGCFLKPWETSMDEVNGVDVNTEHRLVGVCGGEGIVEYWDPRVFQRVGGFLVGNEATSMKFLDGLTLAVGTCDGKILLYDLRSDKPMLVKEHLRRESIKQIEYHDAQSQLLSVSSHCVKIWDRTSGEPMVTLEPPQKINDIAVQQGSGLVMLANEGPRIQTFYVPVLGPAPSWCSFLDSITEELEELNERRSSEEYRFVTAGELEKIGLGHLIGTDTVRAHMHGYFISNRLYIETMSLIAPFLHEEYKKERIRTLLKTEMDTRVEIVKEDERMIEDERFRAIIEDPDFKIDAACKEETAKYEEISDDEHYEEISEHPVRAVLGYPGPYIKGYRRINKHNRKENGRQHQKKTR